MKNIFIVFFFIGAVNINAQPPEGINYQGVARDSIGHPLLNQSIGIRLSILDSSSSGQVVYVETHLVLTNNNGLFNLTIGGGVILNGNFVTINWGQNNKWLKIEMDATGGSNYQLLGTTEFLSVPFALYSKNGFPGVSVAGDMIYYNGTSWIQVPGGSYGQTLSYCNGIPTWGGCLPLLATTSVSNISTTTATGGGNIRDRKSVV